MRTLGKIQKEVLEVKFTVKRMKSTHDGFLVGKTCPTEASLIEDWPCEAFHPKTQT